MNEIAHFEGPGVELMSVDANTASMLAKAEIDIQIATAKKYPRSLAKIRVALVGLATLSEDIAGSCVYALPRDNKTIEGPSARFAEILVSEWGNCRAAARVIDEGREFVTAQGIFHDLERNVAISMNVQKRIVGRNGKRFGVDMIGTTSAAASSVAVRNAILKGIPQAYWMEAFAAARETIRGKFETLANRRAKALQVLQGYGATPAQVFALLGVGGEEEISLDHIVTLRGIVTAVRDEGASIEEMIATASNRTAIPSAGSPPPAGKAAPRPTDGQGSFSDEKPEPKKPASQQKPKPETESQRETKPEAVVSTVAEDEGVNESTGEVLSSEQVESIITEIETQLAAATTRDQVLEVVEGLTSGMDLPQSADERIEALSDAAIQRIMDGMSGPSETPEDHIETGDGDPVGDTFPGDIPDPVVNMDEVRRDLDACSTLEALASVAAKYKGRNFGEHGSEAGKLYTAAEKRIKGATKKAASPPPAKAASKKPLFEIIDEIKAAQSAAVSIEGLDTIWTEQVLPIEKRLTNDERADLKANHEKNSYRVNRV